jgi:thymidylate synthase (FAD)
MRIVKPDATLIWMTPEPLRMIELCGRTCYKSQDKITHDSAKKFVKMLLTNGHESVIEHACMSYRVICDRGVSHEIVRHRLFSYSQESTRYVKYDDIEVVCPPAPAWTIPDWIASMNKAEATYKTMLSWGANPEIARSVLPNSLKTEIVITGNFREWRHFFKMRTSKKAHPQMREVADLILRDAVSRVAIVFDEFVEDIYELSK